MPTADRTTIKAAIDELVNKLRTNLAAIPPTATKPFRRVEVGDPGAPGEEYPRPFLTVRLVRAKPIAVVNDDKVMEVTTALRMVSDVSASDPHGAMLDKIGALDDYLDSIRDSGVIDGAEGFDDRVWTFDYPKVTAGSRIAIAEATQSFVVKVQRTFNRVPAA